MPAPPSPRAPETDLDWLGLHLAALFRSDARGRLRDSNEIAPGGPPPRLWVGTTRLGCLWRLRADLPEALAAELSRLAGRELPAREPRALPERWPRMRELLEAEAPVEAEGHGPAFRFPGALAEPEDVAPVPPERADLLGERFPELLGALAARQPVWAALEGGEPVALAWAATRPATAVECGVRTLPGARGRGFGARAVLAWARAVRESGAEPLYSTSCRNRSSRALARRLGLVRYATTAYLR